MLGDSPRFRGFVLVAFLVLFAGSAQRLRLPMLFLRRAGRSANRLIIQVFIISHGWLVLGTVHGNSWNGIHCRFFT
jgi:hypothetical protein